MIKKLLAFARTGVGRVLIAGIGVLCVSLILRKIGVARVWTSIGRVAPVIPLVFLFEGIIGALELWSLRECYGPDRDKLPFAEVVRVGLMAYAVAGLAPAGRPVAEGVRGTALARWTSPARAAAAGTRVQAVLLGAQAFICVPCAIAAFAIHAPPLLPISVLANGLLVGVLGFGAFFTARSNKVGGWLAKLFPKQDGEGPSFDKLLREEHTPPSAIVCSVVARIFESAKYAVLMAAVGGGFNILRIFTAHGVHMVAATLGDLIPSHVGATEANFTISAPTLHLRPSDALALPLVCHAMQMVWVLIGLLVPLFWPPADPAAFAAERSARQATAGKA